MKNYKQEMIKLGDIVYLKDYTAPKVFRTLFFECLVTDQIIPIAKNIKITKRCGKINNWPHWIYKPERFKEYIK